MSKINDLTGKRFGKWLVIKKSGNARNGSTLWECKCECGNDGVLYGSDLVNGKTLSCKRCSKIKHGKYGTKLYMVWGAMVQRCKNPKNKGYKNYGGRGITVCNEWRNNYQSFESWATSNGYEYGLLLDRQRNDEGYSPENCRWVTREVQNNNRRSCRYIRVGSEMLSIAQAAKVVGVNKDTLRHGLNRLEGKAT